MMERQHPILKPSGTPSSCPQCGRSGTYRITSAGIGSTVTACSHCGFTVDAPNHGKNNRSPQ